MSWYTAIFGDPNKKALQKIDPLVEQINNLEKDYENLSDEAIKNKTAELKKRLKAGETLDDILPDAFATVREAAKRTLGMRHYDVQLKGGIFLNQGKIAEMRTGEGKTLTATLPVYLRALEGKGAHVVTVNDYLAKRDAVWMGQIYDFLGLSVGIIQNQRISYVYDPSFTGGEEGGDADEERDTTGDYKVEDEYLRSVTRKEAYQCDITYGTNNEFGFDYLRDNMVQKFSDMVMRQHTPMHYAIVDEIDSILIDEARTPLIISAPAEEATEQYYRFAQLVRSLTPETDYNVDEKMRSVTLTDEGIAKLEQALGVENIYVSGGVRTVHHIEQALKAKELFLKDRDYIVDEGEVIIIDQFTGRKMPGRRYSEGLHQAIEAKEGVDIKRESQTLATITFQNLFRMYDTLAGMTGTAYTEQEEFFSIYALDVVVLPTNRPDARTDHSDRIYKNNTAKYQAVLAKVKECQEKGQPVLIGTVSVEKNEELSVFLDAHGVKHEALNAKNHEREGEIIAQAGRPGAVTLATNMAGRGVDIKLGGNPVSEAEAKKVRDAGGLFVLGTERHESRRIDNQLRGRSARQGDPGETQFFVSTEDDLMRIFAGDRLKNVMDRLNVPDDMPIEQKMITRMLENAQKKVEGFHFDSRKRILEYDDVLNRHREVVYAKRKQILALAEQEQAMAEGEEHEHPDIEHYESLRDMILDMTRAEIEFVVSYHTNPEEPNQWDVQEVFETMRTIMPFNQEERDTFFTMSEQEPDGKLDTVEVRDKLINWLEEKVVREYDSLTARVRKQIDTESHADDVMRELQKSVLLRAIDMLWVEHLVSIDYLRSSIGLRGYAQRDPLVEYKKETYYMFNNLLATIQKEVVHTFFKIEAGLQIAPSIMATDKAQMQGATKSSNVNAQPAVEKKPRTVDGEKVGRNDPCPCGSGKKYKKCCGK